MDYPLRPICSAWIEKIRLALEYKKKCFGDDAEEAMAFYNGPHDFMYGAKYATGSRGLVLSGTSEVNPTFRMTHNKVAECVQLYGPVLYHRNPHRMVSPRKLPAPPIDLFGPADDPMVQSYYAQVMLRAQIGRGVDKARAALLEHYLNYTPNELDLKGESRKAIDEALIKGMGCLWTELTRPAGMGIQMVGSFYDSVDHLVIDPDMESIGDATWIARRCVHPVWQVEREYGLRPGTLKGNYESYNSQAAGNIYDDANNYNRSRGMTNDLLCYWKLYSKMGAGARLPGVAGALRGALEQLGDYCFLVLCEGCPYPINLSPEAMESAGLDDVRARLAWPTPFWADGDWPFTPIVFHQIPRSLWPMSHFKPAMGELKFLNWAYSFLASKIRTTCRDFIALRKSAAEELKRAVLSGSDLELLEIEHEYGTISEVVQFLQHPSMQGDIWRVIEAVTAVFEKRVGLTELVYGMSARQLRSAAEAHIKIDQMSVRPDDMATKVEEAMTAVARKEALAARYHLNAEDVRPIMGDMGADGWERLVMTSDLQTIVREMEYRIEAGSTRKPNRDRDAENMVQAMQTIMPILMNHASMTGDFRAVNNLLADWAKSIDLDPERYILAPPPPPPPAGPPPPPPSGPPPPPQAGPPPWPAGGGGPQQQGGEIPADQGDPAMMAPGPIG